MKNAVFFKPKSWWKYDIYCLLKSSHFELFRDRKYVSFWAKKLMERWYLLITEKILFWTFRWWEIWSFFQPKSWKKDDICLAFLSFPWCSRTWEIWLFVQWKPFTKNCEVGIELLSLVSVKIRTFICFITSSFNCSNLFGSELIFIFSTIMLFTFLNLRVLISDKVSRDASCMDLSLKLFSSAKLSELDFFIATILKINKIFLFP